MIMHPGPVKYGVEIDKEVTHDNRSDILNQVQNGVIYAYVYFRAFN